MKQGKYNNPLIGHLAAFGAYAIFGLNIIFCKDITHCGIIAPSVMFTLRAAGASALFWLISFFMPSERIAPLDYGKIVVASVVGLFIPQYAFLVACTMTTAIDISLLGTLTPIFTMFIAALVLREPITWKKASGVAISFVGVLLLIFNSVVHPNGVDRSTPLGVALILLNSFSFAVYLGVFRPLIARYSVVTFMKWMFLCSLLFSLPLSARGLFTTSYASLSSQVVGEVVFVIIFATFVAYFLIPVGQKRIRPTLVSMYTYLQPMIATAIAIATGMDVMTWQKALAALLVISGVMIVNRSRAAQS